MQPRACDCNATAGDVTVFDEGGTVTAWAPQPDDEEGAAKAPELP